jgi:hypothetical protein
MRAVTPSTNQCTTDCCAALQRVDALIRAGVQVGYRPAC